MRARRSENISHSVTGEHEKPKGNEGASLRCLQVSVLRVWLEDWQVCDCFSRRTSVPGNRNCLYHQENEN